MENKVNTKPTEYFNVDKEMAWYVMAEPKKPTPILSIPVPKPTKKR